MLYVTHWCSACQIQTPEQHWYLAHLLGYDYSIQYRAGKTNAAADALSRRLEHHPDQLFLLTIPNFLSLQELKKELSVNPTFVDPHPPDLSPINPHISLNALAGIPVTDTFRVYDFINQASLIVLVDSGSTHNFVQPQVAKFLNLPVVDIPPLRVMVGNGLVLE